MDFAFWVFGQIAKGGQEARERVISALRQELKLAA
jgi:hypothetical protein